MAASLVVQIAGCAAWAALIVCALAAIAIGASMAAEPDDPERFAQCHHVRMIQPPYDQDADQ